jgi:hypothetical protein
LSIANNSALFSLIGTTYGGDGVKTFGLPNLQVKWVPVTPEDLRPFGAGLGSGVVIGFPSGACGVVESARVARWFARQSADQCGPCVHGLAAIGGGLAQLAARAGQLPQGGDKDVRRQVAIICSMTPGERRYPKTIDGSRKRRIATGSGTQVSDVNRLLKNFLQMQKMMKGMSGKGGMGRMMRALGGRLPPGIH